MSDMDTDRFDGAPCYTCGADAVGVFPIAEGSRIEDRAVCGQCADDFITICPGCDYHVWVNSCTRIGAELHCADCAAKHPVIVGATMAGIQADEDFDEFQQVRR
jgi:hypothetical protein